MTFQLSESGLINVEPYAKLSYGGSEKGQKKFISGRGFAAEESGFLIDQNVLLVSINYRFFMPKFGLSEKPMVKTTYIPDVNGHKVL